MCQLKDFNHLELDSLHNEELRNELDEWHKNYLPCGKNVIDIGAGCGETAQFYLNHGAEKVVCIEFEESALRCLRKNFGGDKRVVIVPVRVDSLKVDIEGSENGMVIETHFPHFWKLEKWTSDTIQLWRLNQVIASSVDTEHIQVEDTAIRQSMSWKMMAIPRKVASWIGYR